MNIGLLLDGLFFYLVSFLCLPRPRPRLVEKHAEVGVDAGRERVDPHRSNDSHGILAGTGVLGWFGLSCSDAPVQEGEASLHFVKSAAMFSLFSFKLLDTLPTILAIPFMRPDEHHIESCILDIMKRLRRLRMMVADLEPCD